MPKTTPTPRVPTFPPADCTEPSPSIVNASESKEVIPLAEKEGYVTHTEAGLVIKEGMPFETWLAGAPTYEMMFRKAPWWWGDYLIYGAKHYGEMHAQAVSGYTEGHVDNVVSVCERFPVERRQATLFFSHHKAAASLPPQEADRLLLQASREHWTLKDVASKVSLYHEVNGTKPKRGRNKKGAHVHFKVNANAVSEPLTIDGHIEVQEKPLIWDAKPLRVENVNGYRQIYAGNVSLANDEADKAAESFGHAHGPALAAWLEEHNFIKPEGGESTCAQTTTSQCSDKSKSPPSPTASGLDTPEKIASASNGAAPNATESAPTPKSGPANEKFVDTPLLVAKRRAFDYPNQENLDELIRQAQNAVNVAPAAPPASPEAIETAQRHQEELWELQRACDALRKELWGASKEREELKIELEECKHQNGVSARETQLETERDDARDQLKRYDAHTDMMTPLQRAEESILRFNEASKAVDWAEVGRNALRRVKWLGAEGSPGLLNRPDEIIDILQKNPPTPRK